MRRLEHLRLILEINILTNYITLFLKYSIKILYYLYILHIKTNYKILYFYFFFLLNSSIYDSWKGECVVLARIANNKFTKSFSIILFFFSLSLHPIPLGWERVQGGIGWEGWKAIPLGCSALRQGRVLGGRAIPPSLRMDFLWKMGITTFNIKFIYKLVLLN